MSDDALPGRPDAEGWRRLHPLSPLLRGGLALLVILGIVISNFRDHLANLLFASSVPGDGSDPGAEVAVEGGVVELYEYLEGRGLALAALAAVLGVILLIVLFAWIAWRFATYRITDEAVESRHGVLFRNHRRAPLERIQSVNVQRSLLARVLGLAKVQIITAGQGGKVELAYLGYADAKLVREQILRRAAEERGDALADGTGRPEHVGPDGVAFLPAQDRLTARAQEFVDADIDSEALEASALVRVPVGRLMLSILLSWETVSVLALLAAVILGGVFFHPAYLFGLIPMIIASLSVVVGAFNKGFNFTLSRGRDSVRTGSGLTSTVTETIPFGRIHAVEAKQPLLWRPFAWWKVRITTAGHSVAQGGQNSRQNVVLPVGPEDEVLRVLETLLPGVGQAPQEIEALRDGLTGSGEGYTGAGPRAFWVLLWGRRRAGILLDSEPDRGRGAATLRVRRGVLTRSLSVMPIVRAQSVQLRRPLLHRALGLASIQAHTVLGPVRMEMRGLGLDTARGFFDDLAREVLRVQRDEGAQDEARPRAPYVPAPPSAPENDSRGSDPGEGAA